jgi:RND family efflux transporter MFP subunit
MKKYLLTIVILILNGCEQAPEPPPPPRPALVMEVGNRDVAQYGMLLVGEVKSRYESNVGFRISGKINTRYVNVGDVVKRGQAIASLDAIDANLNAQAAGADVNVAEANLSLAKAELDRQRQLYEKKFISKSALDMREAEYKTATARYQQTKSQASVASNQPRYTKLQADRDGVVAMINAEPGQVVSAGQIVAKIVDPYSTEILLAVPESRMREVSIHMPVTIKLWADQQKTYQGMVREISPVANESTRAFDVRIAVKDADADMRFGMTAGVRFDQISTAQIMVPSTAVTEIAGNRSVWVIGSDGVAQPRQVTVGAFTEHGIQVLSGLKAGEMVAIAGVHTLVKGMRVKPMRATTKNVHGEYE